MQIQINFTCRECSQPVALHTDTADYGVFDQAQFKDGIAVQTSVVLAPILPLRCAGFAKDSATKTCGHVSGELALGYRFRHKHGPSSNLEQCPGSGQLVTRYDRPTGQATCPVCDRRTLVIGAGAPHLRLASHAPKEANQGG